MTDERHDLRKVEEKDGEQFNKTFSNNIDLRKSETAKRKEEKDERNNEKPIL